MRNRVSMISPILALLVIGTYAWTPPRHTAAQETAPQESGAAADPAAVTRLVTDFRRAKLNAKRRVRVALELAELGDPAIAKLQEPLDMELEQLAQDLEETLSSKNPLDMDLAQLRKILEDLRNDPALTEDKLRRQGKLALERLNTIYPAWYRQYQAQRAKTGRVFEQLATIRETCRALSDHWPEAKRPLAIDNYLEQVEAMTAKAAPPEWETEIARVQAANNQVARQLPRNVLEGINAVNQLRIVCGLAPLEVDLKLCQASWGHSREMHNLDFFSHESPVPGKKTFVDRAKQADTSAAAENIYAGSTSGGRAVEAWFYSPGHHKAMLGSHRRLGLGNFQRHWTLLLGG